MMTTKLNNNTFIAENHDRQEKQLKTRFDKMEIEYNSCRQSCLDGGGCVERRDSFKSK